VKKIEKTEKPPLNNSDQIVAFVHCRALPSGVSGRCHTGTVQRRIHPERLAGLVQQAWLQCLQHRFEGHEHPAHATRRDNA
jgi:hypothetical protein